MNLNLYWEAVLQQDADKMRTFFHEDAFVNWHNTNEHFTAEEFIRANCEYPGEWDGTIERVERSGDVFITVVHVFTTDRSQQFHVTSFIRVSGDKICSIDEYWGDDGPAPQWRQDKNIGRPIRNT